MTKPNLPKRRPNGSNITLPPSPKKDTKKFQKTEQRGHERFLDLISIRLNNPINLCISYTHPAALSTPNTHNRYTLHHEVQASPGLDNRAHLLEN